MLRFKREVVPFQTVKYKIFETFLVIIIIVLQCTLRNVVEHNYVAGEILVNLANQINCHICLLSVLIVKPKFVEYFPTNP